MIKTEIIIGRQGEFKVEEPSVSRQHAKVIRTKEGIYIEDLASTGGTYVNGKSVKKKKITAADTVMLGTDYKLNVSKILRLLPISDEEFKTALLHLKDVYEKYSAERNKIQSESQTKSMVQRSIPMSLMGLVTSIGSYGANQLWGQSKYTVYIIIGGSLLTTLGMIGGAIWGAKESAKMPERLAKLQEQFMIDYSCPSCGREFGMRSWESLKRQGKCLACQREFDLDEEQ